MTETSIQQTFSLPLLAWFDQHGRKDLPWQHPRTAYRVWISEIMLQQTQVKTVIPYFNRFVTRFPTIQSLASAAEDDVLAHWSGLGYYSRARNLHKTAAIVDTHFNGDFPSDLDNLITLPGIGPSTAAAIASLAFNKSTAILDGNVKRVLSRYFLVSGPPNQATVHKKLWQLANECMPTKRCADYTQAIMDLGATCCTIKNPKCVSCPLKTTCLAKTLNEIENYPEKKPKKSIPIKQEQFLLLHKNEGTIYLEKRPPTGLWGGLWCLPTIEMDKSPLDYIEQSYCLKTNEVSELMTINHSFSHFHLQIKALAIGVTYEATRIAELSGRWFRPEEIGGLGIAKPVNDIIRCFLGRA